MTEDERGAMLYEFVTAHDSYIAALSCLYRSAIDKGLPSRIAEEYVLMVMVQVKAIVQEGEPCSSA